jgi:hypothetical protein
VTEDDYITLTNLAKVRIIVDIVRDLFPDGKIITTSARDSMLSLLNRWEDELGRESVDRSEE